MKDELNDKIIGTMFKVFKAMKDTMSFNSKSSHLTMVQFEALICLKKHKELHMKDLADYFVKSVGESEINALTLYNAGQLNPAFVGSTHEYHRSWVLDKYYIS